MLRKCRYRNMYKIFIQHMDKIIKGFHLDESHIDDTEEEKIEMDK